MSGISRLDLVPAARVVPEVIALDRRKLRISSHTSRRTTRGSKLGDVRPLEVFVSLTFLYANGGLYDVEERVVGEMRQWNFWHNYHLN
jgi:hypothetical protein